MSHDVKDGAGNWQPSPETDIERNLVEVAELALAEAAKRGATMAAAGVEQGQGISVTVRNGEVETIEHNRDKSLAVGVYFDHRSGNADTTDFSPDAVRQTVAHACNIAQFTEQDKCNGLADAEYFATQFPNLDLHHPWEIAIDDAIDIAAQCESAAVDFDRRISNTEGATLSSHHGIGLYANSGGFRGLERGSRHSLACSVIAGAGDAMQRDYWYDSARDKNELCEARKLGAESARRTLRRLDAKKARTGECAVIFESNVAGSLISHLVAAVSGSRLYRKATFLLDKAGSQIFPRNIRIHEQPHLPKSLGAANFDGEGVATCARDLVADGVLRGYVLNSYSARKLGLQTTGNSGGVRNLTVEPTMRGGLKELIKNMGRGLVVSELIGFGVNTVTGDYSRGAFGFWVENGEIQYPVQEFTIAGNLSKMFAAMSAVADDINPHRNIRCGSILIDAMTIAGK